MLIVKHINYSAGRKQIIRNLSAVFFPGRINFILGPNGSGKSTFLRICTRQLLPGSGSIEMDGSMMDSYSIPELARKRAVLSQQPTLDFPLTVADVVMMGRYPHFDVNPSKADLDICNEVMDLLNISGFKNESYPHLSGGEKQRVQFGRALVQIWKYKGESNRYLFLDEPFNNLDIRYQLEFLKILRSITDERTVLIATIHDLNLASSFGDELFLFKDGTVAASGTPDKVLVPELIHSVFGVNAEIMVGGGRSHITYS